MYDAFVRVVNPVMFTFIHLQENKIRNNKETPMGQRKSHISLMFTIFSTKVVRVISNCSARHI